MTRKIQPKAHDTDLSILSGWIKLDAILDHMTRTEAQLLREFLSLQESEERGHRRLGRSLVGRISRRPSVRRCAQFLIQRWTIEQYAALLDGPDRQASTEPDAGNSISARNARALALSLYRHAQRSEDGAAQVAEWLATTAPFQGLTYRTFCGIEDRP